MRVDSSWLLDKLCLSASICFNIDSTSCNVYATRSELLDDLRKILSSVIASCSLFLETFNCSSNE